MKLGQISSAKFPPKAHIQSGTAALKPVAGSKLLGCFCHATDAVPNGGTALNRGFGKLQLCKQNSEGNAAWSTVDAPDWCGLVDFLGATYVINGAAPAGNPIDITQLTATSIVKFWVRGAGGGTVGHIYASINAGVAVTLGSFLAGVGGANAAERSNVYVEITY